MKLGTIVGIVLLLGIGVAVAAGVVDKYPSAYVKYKMTVEVDTPEGVKAGSAVREVHLYIAPNAPRFSYRAPQGHIGVKGEAVVVDLGKRGKLFALLGEDDAYRVLFKSFPKPGGGPLTPDGVRWYKTLKTGEKTLEPQDYPRMVMFKDMNDPKSVQLVYEEEPVNVQNQAKFNYIVHNNMEALFGKNVKLKNVTIKITNEPVTRRIEGVLPWLPSVAMSYLNGQHTSRNAPLGLHGGQFIEGEK